MKKANIVIASVLKPLTDSRAFGKFAISLRETNKYHINIIGFLEKNPPKQDNIEFKPIFGNQRLHPNRLLAPLKFLYWLKKIKPQLVIVTTYELLPAAAIMKAFLGFQLVYDVQENYSKNISFNNTLPFWLRFLAGKYVQFVEKITTPFVDHFFFAEQCYQEELAGFRPYTIIENKFSGPVQPVLPFKISRNNLKFLITGTITPVYGVEEAIHWFKFIQQHYPSSRLKLKGHVPLADYRSKLKKVSQSIPALTLEISGRPVPYGDIQQAIHQADILLLPYQNLPSIWPKIPSKLYEGIALGKPVIIPKNPKWEHIIDQYPAGVALEFDQPEKSLETFEALFTRTFYTRPPGQEVSWDSEQEKLLTVVDKLLPAQK
ncbi:hypothetical protein GCM10028791_39920 [Echinicola sediminis]